MHCSGLSIARTVGNTVNTRTADYLRHLVFGGSQGCLNAWYAPFYDLIQTALSSPQSHHRSILPRSGRLSGIALIAVVISVLNNFLSVTTFRWRTAMNEYYAANWQQLRHIEGRAAVQEDAAFCFNAGEYGAALSTLS